MQYQNIIQYLKGMVLKMNNSNIQHILNIRSKLIGAFMVPVALIIFLGIVSYSKAY